MSYDLEIGVQIAGTSIIASIAEPEYDSPTYNLGKMFKACMGWDFEQGRWYRVEDVIYKIEHGIHELRHNEKAYKKYNPKNGWGDTKSALEALESLYKCIKNCSDGWLFDIPMEHLWVRW